MSKLLKQYLLFWLRLFWTTVLFAVITVAVLIQIARSVFPVIDDYRINIEAQLSLQLGVNLSIGEIEAVWQGLRPQVTFNEVSIMDELGAPVFEIGQINVELSILKTLYTKSLYFRRLSFQYLEASIVQTVAGTWQVQGMPQSTSLKSSKSEEFTIDDPLDVFLFGRRVELTDTALDFTFADGLQSSVVIPNIRLENDAKFHRLSASFAVDGEKQELNFLLEGLGDPRDEAEFEASGFVTLSDFPIERVFAAIGVNQDVLLPKDKAAERNHWQESGRVNLNLWFARTAEKGINWQGDINVQGVPLIPRDGMVWPQTLKADFSGDWQLQQGWNLQLSELGFQWHDFSSPMLNVNAYGGRGEPIKLAVESINVEDWYSVVDKAGFVFGGLKDVLSDLKPQGQLKNIWMELLNKERGYFSLAAIVENGQVQPWEDVPAIGGVNGYLEANAFGGHITLNSQEGFSLGFPKIYQHPLLFNEAKGDVRWQVDLANHHVGVSSGQLSLKNDDVSAKGHFNLSIPFVSSPGVEAEMTLMIGVDKGVASLHKMLVPYTVPKKLNEWLGRSIKEGLLTNAGFIYHGSLAQENTLARVIQFSANVQQANLKFDPKWPALIDASGVMLLDNEDFRATNLRGRMMNTMITDGEISLVKLPVIDILGESTNGFEHAISIKANVSGDSGHAMALLKKTPIAHIIGNELASWGLKGNVQGRVAVVVPLDEQSPAAEQDIQLELLDNQLNIPSLNLMVTQISGPFVYTSTGGVESSGLQAKLWGQDLHAKITTKQKSLDSAIEVDFVGDVDIERLQKWSQRPELKFTKGVTSVNAQLSVPLLQQNSPIRIHATTALEGIQIDLPAPFNKVADQSLAFQMNIDVFPSGANAKGNINNIGVQKYWLSVGNGLGEAVIVNENDALKGISLVLGTSAVDKEVEQGVINVTGELAVADIGLWSESITKYDQYVQQQKKIAPSGGKHSSDVVESQALLKMNVQVAELQLGELSFEAASVSARQEKEAYIFQLASKDVSGKCTLFNDSRPMLIELDHFYLNQDEVDVPVAESVVIDESGGLIDIDVSSLPAMDFSVKEFKSGARNYGQWLFKLRPINGGVIAYDLKAKVLGLTIQGKKQNGAELIWLQSGEKNETFFSGLVTAKNIGPVMEKWDMERALTSQSAKFITDLQWFGTPDQIALERLFGIMDVELEHGRFIRGAVGEGNPLVKLAGLLNFDTLARRFRFDFSDLHPEGMSYDKVQGSFQFKRGVVTTQQPLLASMPASDIQFEGDIYLLTEQVDAQLVITLPIAGLSTTIAAALTGGVPLAVGVFVVGKVFKSQLDQASSVRYRVHGSWDDPSMDMEKVFDNTMEN